MDDAKSRELLLIAEIDIFANRQIWEQGLLLKHHSDSLQVGVGGALDAGFLPGNEDLPGVRLINAAQDLHESGFAGAILANEAHDLSRSDLDRDGLERMHPWEALLDSDHRDRCVDARAHLTTRVLRLMESATAPMIIMP